MKEIVQKIMDTEREIRERIEQAGGEAQKIVRRAEAQSRETEELSRQKAVLKLDSTLHFSCTSDSEAGNGGKDEEA